MNFQLRRRRVLRAMQAARVPAMLVSNPVNVAYLSGFHSSNGFLILAPGGTFVITDFRYETAARELATAQKMELVIAKDGIGRAVAAVCRHQQMRALAYEADHLTVAAFTALQKAARSLRWQPAQPWIMAERLVKDADELACMRTAIAVAENGFATIRDHEWIGLTEREAAELLEERIKSAAHKIGVHAEPSFSFIIAAGSNAAVPHHHPGATVIHEDQMLTIDWGARVDNYCSDMTRTLFLGTPDAQFKKIYGIVLKAQLAAIRAVKAGVTFKQIDAAARDIITAAGYGKNFGHATGHRIGMDVHEGMKLAKGNVERARAGMVTTIEPGIYIPGWGGVRIEDMALVTPRGRDVLTSLPK